MVYDISNSKSFLSSRINLRNLLIRFSGIFLLIASLTIFQDFLESKRSGFAFYLHESILFKTVWLLFIPILLVLSGIIKNKPINSVRKIFISISSALLAHLFILPIVAALLSALFYEGRYDFFKFFSYTLANDLYKIVTIYSIFVLGYRYFSNQTIIAPAIGKSSLETLIINNGKDNVVLKVSDIIHITAASPYLSIHLSNKDYLYLDTLKSICEKLDPEIFVRIHKSTVVNISKVLSFKSRLNGDYDLKLIDGISVRLSRTYAADFKKQFSSGHRVDL